MSRRRQQGFTIVEFMIAATVFGIIMLIVSGAILYMNKTYQKSLNASRNQAATSNLIDVVAQAVKFSASPIMYGGDPTTGNTATICIGNRQFLYVIGKQVGGSVASTKTQHAVVSRPNTSNCSHLDDIIVTANPPGNPKELLGRGMRLIKLHIDDSHAPLYTVSAKVAYGDDDVLCSDSVVHGGVNSCDAGAPTMTAAELRNEDIHCKPSKGSEFCSVSELSTTAYRRL